MKKIITSLCLSFVFVIMAFTESKANTYYVLDEQEFTLTPDAVAGTFSSILWTVDNVALSPILTGVGALTKSFKLTNSGTAEEHKIKLGVIASLGGCLSELVEHTVVVIPKLSLSITTPKDNFCVGAFSADLTVNVSLDATALGLLKSKYNITLAPFAWTGGGTANGNVLTINQAGNYSVSGDYLVLEGTNVVSGALIPTATKILGQGAIAGASKLIKNDLAIPVVTNLLFN
ncbi:hypothetical protein [Dyadobacter sp. CY356]|uniref:hypothetical protein n=1 Tax=Dyadobacter sp. CY356 TaxID=2906442 RepID=UPI001F48DD1D|nr:hypothetical protein [Dyadobacter sp. CY356]MCF0058163.1 hypothetical protein [Dyadobacter sp. CY356]